jgi:hypothetical protein
MMDSNEVIGILKSETTLDVLDVLGQKQDRYWAYLSAVIVAGGAILFFFIGNRFSSIKNSITGELKTTLSNDEQFKASIGAYVEARQTELVLRELETTRRELAKLRLSATVEEMNVGDSFSNSLKHAAMEQLRLIAEDEHALRSPSFRVTFKQVLGNFMRADLGMELNEIYGLFSTQLEEMAKSLSKDETKDLVALMSNLLQHYGQKYLGAHDVERADSKQIERLVDTFKQLNFYERAIPYVLIAEHDKSKNASTSASAKLSEKRLKALLIDYAHLTERERQVASLLIFEVFSDITKMAVTPTAELIRMVERTNAFIQDFGDQLDPVPAPPGQDAPTEDPPPPV